MDNATMIIGNFNIPFSIMDRNQQRNRGVERHYKQTSIEHSIQQQQKTYSS